ncbi:membrane protein insertion efficiency factor YidD [Nesterenkonia sp. Act20]|uniref:membrane protein insertion efficiency factor YidD n=1 Tax=Nesterenkonia sp. Act20 TaxID=1483432 RepID=UPI001C444430|nr:membrane protein insertion efficiency factor YidD [Nesterenkonia sp. Act20]
MLLALLIKGYRKVISPLYGQVCSFYPSCSAYGLEAVTAHGVIRGVPLTGWRVLRCNPFTGGGVDPVPASSRIWPQGAVPTIIETNHPPIPRGDDD